MEEESKTVKEYYISKINYKNMIQNLADMYPFDISEVVLVECIANSLDAKSSKIEINFDPERKILIIRDNGKGMTESQFSQYHDFAMGLKSRGDGIGFAGLGAKISFNIADRVLTETFSQNFSGGSNWGFTQDGDLVWEPIKPVSLSGTGTKVEIFFKKDAKIKYQTTDDIREVLSRHYAPLLDEQFLDFYKIVKCYEKSPKFFINGEPINSTVFIKQYSMTNYEQKIIRTSGKAKNPIGFISFGLVSENQETGYPGILLCTWGKVVKSDFMNQFPGELMSRIFGIAEVPNFVKFLTTSKCDFNRQKDPVKFNLYYKPIRDIFVEWLKKLGVDKTEELKEESKELERELSKIFNSLPDIPELMHRKATKKVYSQSLEGQESISEVTGLATFPNGEGTQGVSEGITGPDPSGEDNAYQQNEKGKERGKSISRKSKSGPKIAFQNVQEKEEMGWVDSEIVYINSGHPGYKKTSSNKKSRLMFNLVAIAVALQRYLDPGDHRIDLTFIDKFLYAWGE